MMAMRTLVISSLSLLAILAALGWGSVELRRHHVWDHFDVVKPGLIYRSGELRPDQLAHIVRRYRIKTVVNLQMRSEGADRERVFARKLGVDYLNLPMPGDGFGREAQFREALQAMDDPNRSPVLIHCARGTCRTGAAVALYRFERDGWTIEDVAAEMVRQTYRDHWLPGYVHAMVHRRPFDSLYRPGVIDDRRTAPPSAAEATRDLKPPSSSRLSEPQESLGVEEPEIEAPPLFEALDR
jgi:protein-tyrosine phosphatase